MSAVDKASILSIWLPIPDHDESHVSIRLVEVLPGQHGSQIRTQLHIKSIPRDKANPYPYEAISYRWSDSSPKYRILCNGHLVDIGKNLYSALETFRLPNRSRLLWTDQLCIQQEDTLEKERQLPEMGNIYQLAEQTLVYLGPNLDQAELAFRFFEDFLSKLGQCKTEREMVDKMRKIDMWPLRSKDQQVLKAVRALTANSYFSRTWTLQEMFLSKACLFFYGHQCIETKPLLSGLLLACTHLTLPADQQQYRKYIESILRLLLPKGHARNCTLFELLTIVQPLHCTVPTDKIYALSMLLRHYEPRLETLIPPKGGDEVSSFVKATHTLMEAEGTLDLLSKAGLWLKAGDRSSISAVDWRLPSWCPDWNSIPAGNEAKEQIFSHGCSFLATLDSKPGSIWSDKWPKKLVLNGVVLSTIETFSSVGPEKINTIDHQPVGGVDVPPLPREDLSLRSYVRKTIEHLARFEPLLKFAEDTNAKSTSKGSSFSTWKVLTAYDKSWTLRNMFIASEEIAEDHFEYFRRSMQAWSKSASKGHHKGMQALLSTMMTRIGLGHSQETQPNFINGTQVYGRRFARDSDCQLLNVPSSVKTGDIVALLPGGPVPYVLRIKNPDGQKTDNVPCYKCQLIGDCYLDGAMYGDRWDEKKRVRIELM